MCRSLLSLVIMDPSADTAVWIQGFDGYLKPPTTGGAHKRKAEVTEPERLFSGSSLTYAKVHSPFFHLLSCHSVLVAGHQMF